MLHFRRSGVKFINELSVVVVVGDVKIGGNYKSRSFPDRKVALPQSEVAGGLVT